MEFNDYQKLAWKTAIYPNKSNNIYYPSLGLAGETGEVCEKIKKIMRDCDGQVTAERKNEIKKELGDVFWYVAALCTELQLNMNDVAESNIEKLYDRKARNKLQGNGDNR